MLHDAIVFVRASTIRRPSQMLCVILHHLHRLVVGVEELQGALVGHAPVRKPLIWSLPLPLTPGTAMQILSLADTLRVTTFAARALPAPSTKVRMVSGYF